MKKKESMGRPPYSPKLGECEKVELLRACGWSDKEIAIVIGVSVPTLKKTFFKELNEGPLKQKAENLKQILAAAKKGNVSAQKYLNETITASIANEEFLKSQKIDKADEPKPLRLGKKAQADAEALDAGKGTNWGGDLTPTVFGLN